MFYPNFSFFRSKKIFYIFIIWLIIALWYNIFSHQFFPEAIQKTKDFFASQSFYIFSRQVPSAEKIIIVAVDEYTRNKLNLKWPWPRGITAQLITKAINKGAKVVGLDIIFSGVSDSENDQKLLEVLINSPQAVCGYLLTRQEKDQWQKKLHKLKKEKGFVNKPLDPFSKLKEEKVARQLLLYYYDNQEGIFHNSIELEIIRHYLGIKQDDIIISQAGKIKIGRLKEFFAPQGILPINYLVHYREIKTIPAYLLLEDKIAGKMFKDKIVLIGVTDPLIHDEYMTPLGVFPGVAIIANGIIMLLEQRFINEISLWGLLGVFSLIAFLIIAINVNFSFLAASLTNLVIFVGLFVCSLLLRAHDIVFDYIGLFFFFFAAVFISILYLYLYTLYINNKIKTIAIRDPQSGLYGQRYFSLFLQERLIKQEISFSLIYIVITNWQQLVLEYDYYQLRQLINIIARHLERYFSKSNKQTLLARLTKDIFAVAFFNSNPDKARMFAEEWLNEIREIDFSLDNLANKTILPKFGLAVLFKEKNQKIDTRQIIEKAKELKQSVKPGQILQLKLETVKKVTIKDFLGEQEDMIVSDIEKRNQELEQALAKLMHSQKELEQAYFEMIRSLTRALEEKDTYTQGHSERVAKYAKKLAQALGLTEEEQDQIYKAALLHDIGKIGIPDYILHKKDKLNDEDIALIRRHQNVSVEILKPIKAFEKLLPIILHHHERFDGTGYPYGLSGEMIPKGAQILAIADSFDAITCGRGYKKGASWVQGIEELEKYSGSQFNPNFIKVFKQVILSWQEE